LGVVYRAPDTSLDRAVAIKILPDAFAADGGRVARFEREAKTLASLNHPNIAIVHGLERGEHGQALVMELVEGEDLSQRIARLRASGASARQAGMPLDEAWPIAEQIGAALEAAHALGIVHRDLKPANIKLRPDGTVKVLDFGLAKALGAEGGGSGEGLSNSPTMANPAMTGAGMLIGTAAYMAPEQARGRPADQRADIWAFGAVLYEMLTGRPAFQGEDVSLTLANVMKGDPDWSALPSSLPPAVIATLKACLQKDPRMRLRNAGDVLLAIGGAFDTGASATVPAQAATDHRGRSWRRISSVQFCTTMIRLECSSSSLDLIRTKRLPSGRTSSGRLPGPCGRNTPEKSSTSLPAVKSGFVVTGTEMSLPPGAR
jgi:serine/threonine protein kinase